MKFVVGAVPGAGKTTVLKYVKKKMPQIKIVNVGDLILDVAMKRFKIRDRDELRKRLTVEQQRFVQDYAYKKISKMRDKVVLIDTHFSIETPSGFFPGISDRVVRLIKPNAIILLEFNPRDVNQRRANDPTRRRDVETEEQIGEHQKINRNFASTAASVAECPVEIVDLRFVQKKDFDQARKGADEIVKLVKRMR